MVTPAAAQTTEVKIALIAPMSGPWARQGELMLKGAKLAIEDINKAGRHQGARRRQAEAASCSMPATAWRRQRTRPSAWSRRSRISSVRPAPGCRASRSASPR